MSDGVRVRITVRVRDEDWGLKGEVKKKKDTQRHTHTKGKTYNSRYPACEQHTRTKPKKQKKIKERKTTSRRERQS